MTGFLRFAAFFALLAAIFVLVVLPFLLSPLLTQMVRDAGFQSETLEVTVAPLDPGLILGRSRRITLKATGVDVPPAEIGRAEIALEDVSLFDRTFERVSGQLDDVTLSLRDGPIHVTQVTVEGSADSAAAVARLSPADTEQLVRLAAARAGIEVDAVDMSESKIGVTIGGVEGTARVAVHAGALVLDPGAGVAIVLLQPAPSEPWSVSEAWISPEGLNIRGEVDVTSLSGAMRHR